MTLRSRVSGSPVLWMLAAVVGFASLPVLIWAGTRDLSPWLFAALWYVARAAVWSVLVQTGFPKTKERLKDRERDKKARRVSIVADLKVIKFGYLIAQAFCGFSGLLFAVAITLSNPSVVTIAFEFWPVFFALLTTTSFWGQRGLKESDSQLENDESGNRIFSMLVMLVIGAAAVALVVISDNQDGLSAWTQRDWLGLLLAVVAAFSIAAGSMNSNLMGADQCDDLSKRDKTSVSVSGNILSTLVLAPVIFIVGLVASAGSDWGFTASGLTFVLCSGFVHPFSNWCFHNGLHLARVKHAQTLVVVAN